MPKQPKKSRRRSTGGRKGPHQRVGSAMKGIIKGRPWKGVKREG